MSAQAPAVLDEQAQMSTAAKVAVVPVLMLTMVNVLNYIDRFVVTALLPDLQRELSLSDTQAGFLGTAFMLVYFVTSPIFGRLGDKGSRKGWIALGVGLWSIATGLGGFAAGFASLLVARAAVGIGEAAQGTISPSLLSDYVPKNRRGKILSFFYIATPVGSALGYLLGGLVGQAYGWRSAFFIVGFPGLLLALAILFLKEPKRGVFDDESEQGTVPMREALKQLWHNRTYIWTVAGYTAYTFAIGGLAFWAPSYFIRERGFEQAQGTMLCGAMIVVTGAIGTLIGGALGDRMQKKSPNGYVNMSAASMIFAAVLSAAALLSPDRTMFLVLLALAEIFMFLSTGPVNAIIVNSVRPGIRSTAVALSIFSIHLFGDAISPTLIGIVADKTRLATGLLLIPLVYLVAAVLWFIARVPPKSSEMRTA